MIIEKIFSEKYNITKDFMFGYLLAHIHLSCSINTRNRWSEHLTWIFFAEKILYLQKLSTAGCGPEREGGLNDIEDLQCWETLEVLLFLYSRTLFASPNFGVKLVECRHSYTPRAREGTVNIAIVGNKHRKAFTAGDITWCSGTQNEYHIREREARGLIG